MSVKIHQGGVHSDRLSAQDYCENFSDIAPVLSAHEARVAADRCYFCHDAPCVTKCPTSIDIPLFIRQIATETPLAAAKTILNQNIFGGMCARVCPTETLCEGACVREAAEGAPVQIGALQRFATDAQMALPQPFTRAEPTGKSVAVVGAGPAGLACAHRLALKGHAVTVYDAAQEAGGLNARGIASYKAPGDFAAREIDWLLQIGGIELRLNWALGRDGGLADLQAAHDAVFLGIGLSGNRDLGLETPETTRPATDFIRELRLAEDLSTLPIGRDVVVIGGGMTAVDAAVQAKLLGARHVTIAYRRARDEMPASAVEQEHALTHGVQILERVIPVSLSAAEVEFALVDAQMQPLGERVTLPADQCFTAIGQTLGETPDGLTRAGGKLATSASGRLTQTVWAGGDCAQGGEDLTVTAVAQGRDAAEDIHLFLIGA